MGRKRHTAEEIVNKLRQAEVELSKGLTMPSVCKLLGVTEQTYYRWRKEYGGLKSDQAKKLEALERENARLKKLVANLSLDNGNCESLNGKLRDELLEREIFYSLNEAKVLIERWRRHYNTVRPHSALGYRPPAPETRAAEPCSASLRTPQQHTTGNESLT